MSSPPPQTSVSSPPFWLSDSPLAGCMVHQHGMECVSSLPTQLNVSSPRWVTYLSLVAWFSALVWRVSSPLSPPIIFSPTCWLSNSPSAGCHGVACVSLSPQPAWAIHLSLAAWFTAAVWHGFHHHSNQVPPNHIAGWAIHLSLTAWVTVTVWRKDIIGENKVIKLPRWRFSCR